MRPPTPPERLTDEEMHYARPGNSPEVQGWNRHFSFMIDEYRTALDAQDEGWVSDVVSEVRKTLGGLKRADCHLAETARRALGRGRRRGCGGRKSFD